MGIKSTQGKNKFEQIDYKATSDIGETLDPVFSADATGGTILYSSSADGNSVEKYHVFTEPGYFRINAGFAKTANVLMIAGGGGGGGYYYGGGGGAGEVLYGSNVGFGTSISNYDRSSGNEYRVIVGEGGHSTMTYGGGQYNQGGNGGDTIIYPTAGIATVYRSFVGFVTEGMRALGGGGGGSYSADGYEEGNSGGSAGGPSYYDEHERFKQRITPDLPDAWTSYANPSGPTSAGSASGGGGAGSNSTTYTGGDGQPFPEFASTIIGPAIPPYVYPYWNAAVGPTGLYGGGGGGGGHPATTPVGGTGGGGAGGAGAVSGEPGVDFTGSGGGGGDSASSSGGSGGKGIVIIKYVV